MLVVINTSANFIEIRRGKLRDGESLELRGDEVDKSYVCANTNSNDEVNIAKF
jgi:hypothetical protein